MYCSTSSLQPCQIPSLHLGEHRTWRAADETAANQITDKGYLAAVCMLILLFTCRSSHAQSRARTLGSAVAMHTRMRTLAEGTRASIAILQSPARTTSAASACW